MKRAEGGWSRGYTIVETMIFLAVSGAMFVSAMALVNGRQARTEFTTTVRNFEAVLADIANDVSNGYYTNATENAKQLSCSATSTNIDNINPPVIITSTTTNKQGTNTGCLFIGKAVQFGAEGDKERFTTLTLVGRQYEGGNPSNGDAESYYASGSGVKAVYPVTATDVTPKAATTAIIGANVSVECVLYGTASSSNPTNNRPCKPSNVTSRNLRPVDTLTFMTTFRARPVESRVESRNSQVDMVVPSSSLVSYPNWTRDISDAASDLNKYYDDSRSVMNPQKGIFICLQSGGSKQRAMLQIGGQSSRFSVNTIISDGTCA